MIGKYYRARGQTGKILDRAEYFIRAAVRAILPPDCAPGEHSTTQEWQDMHNAATIRAIDCVFLAFPGDMLQKFNDDAQKSETPADTLYHAYILKSRHAITDELPGFDELCACNGQPKY